MKNENYEFYLQHVSESSGVQHMSMSTFMKDENYKSYYGDEAHEVSGFQQSAINMSIHHEQHDADPQCLQRQQRSSIPMGSQSSSQQFESVSARHNGRQLSSELRDRHSKSSEPCPIQLGKDDADLGTVLGSQSDELCPVGQSRDEHQGISGECKWGAAFIHQP